MLIDESQKVTSLGITFYVIRPIDITLHNTGFLDYNDSFGGNNAAVLEVINNAINMPITIINGEQTEDISIYAGQVISYMAGSSATIKNTLTGETRTVLIPNNIYNVIKVSGINPITIATDGKIILTGNISSSESTDGSVKGLDPISQNDYNYSVGVVKKCKYYAVAYIDIYTRITVGITFINVTDTMDLPVPTDVPSAPQNVHANPVSSGIATAIGLTWTPPENDSRTITKYQVRIDGGNWIDVNSDTPVFIINSDIPVYSYGFTGLIPNTHHICTVRAVNAYGYGTEATAEATTFPIFGNILYGDVNGDGSVDMIDLIRLARYLAELDPITNPALLAAADVNGDGSVDMIDSIRLARYLAEIDTTPLGT